MGSTDVRLEWTLTRPNPGDPHTLRPAGKSPNPTTQHLLEAWLSTHPQGTHGFCPAVLTFSGSPSAAS